MDIKLIKQLQEVKLFEEDLFPNASPKEVENRFEDWFRTLGFLRSFVNINFNDMNKIRFSKALNYILKEGEMSREEIEELEESLSHWFSLFDDALQETDISV